MTEQPTRIRRSRAKGWVLPPNAVIVTRPTVWGNPFTHHDPAEAVAAYRRLIRGGTQMFEMGPGKLQYVAGAHQGALHYSFPDFIKQQIHRLRGKHLCCWSPLDAPCHADVLLEIANGDLAPKIIGIDRAAPGSEIHVEGAWQDGSFTTTRIARPGEEK